MGFYNFEEVYFQQKKRTTKMRINQENVDNIKRIKLPDFDDEERDTIQGLHKILLKRSMVKNNSNEVGMLVDLRDWSHIMVNGTENGVTLKEDKTIWENYLHFSDAYKRIRIAYIEAARKRPEEFEKRLNNFINKTKENKKITGFGGIEKYY